MGLLAVDLPEIDLVDPGNFVDGVPHEWFRPAPPRGTRLHWHDDPEGAGFWAVTRYDDVVAVSRDHETFSSSAGSAFIMDQRRGGRSSSSGMMMLNMDPPQHTRYRLLVNKGFTPRDDRPARASTSASVTREIVDDVAERGECDFVVDIAAELPLQVIAEMMGVPDEDRHKCSTGPTA